MSRLTISLPDDLHRSLKESAARRGLSIGSLVAEALEFYGIKSRERAEELVARARSQGLSASRGEALAAEETRAVRQAWRDR